jgi:two-component sensor histidine kinase
MQVISSLIQLQSYSLRDELDRELLHETQARINAMAAIHELLYQSPDLSSVDAGEYLGTVIEELSQGYDATGIRCVAETVKLGLDEAMPLGLITNELLMNSIKYAYGAGERGLVEVRLGLEGNIVVLAVADHGKGLAPGIDPMTSTSMGFTLVRSLSEQLGGTITFGATEGFRAELRFPSRQPPEAS